MHKVKFGLLKPTYDTHVIHFDYIAALVKRSIRSGKLKAIRSGKLKAIRASATEEQRIERLRIGRKKDRTRSIKKLITRAI